MIVFFFLVLWYDFFHVMIMPWSHITLRVLLTVILGSVFSISNTNFFIFKVLEKLETLHKITVKRTLKMHLVVILRSIYIISNT